MSEPMTGCKNPIQGAILEIISGISALNMPPDPIDPPEGDFLTERDRMVKHSLEHFNAAIDYLAKVAPEGTTILRGGRRGT